MRRKVISVLLLLLFSATVLPVAQLGELLASNTLNEEVHEQVPQLQDEKSKESCFVLHNLLHPAGCFSKEAVLALGFANLQKEMVPTPPTDDIVAPPPES